MSRVLFRFVVENSTKASVAFQWKKYINFALKYESYIGCTVPPLLRQKHKPFGTSTHALMVFQYFSLYSICSHTGFYAFNILS